MVCCRKEIKPKYVTIDGKIIVFWKCLNCGTLYNQTIGEIDSRKAVPTPDNFYPNSIK